MNFRGYVGSREINTIGSDVTIHGRCGQKWPICRGDNEKTLAVFIFKEIALAEMFGQVNGAFLQEG